MSLFVIHDLIFETKAESKYLSVAAASMIARYAFLCAWDKMEEHYQCTIPKGAGEEVDRFAASFLERYGYDELSKIAKMHFKNTARLKMTLRKCRENQNVDGIILFII